MCCRPCKFFAYPCGTQQELQMLSVDLHSLQVQHKLSEASDILCGPLMSVVKAHSYCLQSSEGSQVQSSHPPSQHFMLLHFLHKKPSLPFLKGVFLPSQNARGILSVLWERATSKQDSFSQKPFLRFQAFVDCLRVFFFFFFFPNHPSFIIERDFIHIHFSNSNLSTAGTVHVLKAISWKRVKVKQ